MSNKEKIGWCVGAVFLVFLFILSSTDLIIKEKEREIYHISVIIEDSNDEYYVNFKKGMDMAAEKYQADVSFITLYEENDAKQQMELVQRENRDGARAVILAPVREDEAVMALDAISPGCPIIFLGSSTLNSSVACSISRDSYEMGRTLGKKVAEREVKSIPVYLLTEELSYTGNTDVYDGVRSALEEEGFTVRLVEKKSEDTYRKVIEGTVYPETGKITIIALDTKALSGAADVMAGSSVYQKSVTGLYGVGSTIEILNGLDKGIIKGIMAWNRFDEGYLSVEKAIESVGGMCAEKKIQMDTFYIEAGDLHKDAYEKMLYPKE